MEACAKLIMAHQELQLESGVVLAVPVPEANEAEGKLIESAIAKGLAELE